MPILGHEVSEPVELLLVLLIVVLTLAITVLIQRWAGE